MATHGSRLLLARLTLLVAPLGCTQPAAPGGPTTAPDKSANTAPPGPETTAAPPATAPPPGTTTRTDATPSDKGPPSTGGSSTKENCYARRPGEDCLAPDAAETGAKLGLKADGTVKHLVPVPSPATSCCYSTQSVSKGRLLIVEGDLRLATLRHRAFG